MIRRREGRREREREREKLTLRTSLEMYAIQSSFRERDFVDLTRSVTEPAPQYSITNWKEREREREKVDSQNKADSESSQCYYSHHHHLRSMSQ